MKNYAIASVAALATAMFAAGTASAADETVKVSGPFQNVTTQFGTVAVYNSATAGESSGGGSTDVTATRADARGGTSALEIHGDRSREVIGSIYGNATNAIGGTANPLALSSLTSVTFDKLTSALGTQQYAEPVLRIHGYDAATNVRFELIDEGVYNGGSVNTATTLNQWATTDASQKWYINVRTNAAAFTAANAGYSVNGSGVVLDSTGSQVNLLLTNLFPFFSSGTNVSGFSIGAGSSFGAGYTGYADYLRVATNAGSTTFNFELAAATAAVPEPATWAMMIAGFGLVGGAMRRRSTKIAFV